MMRGGWGGRRMEARLSVDIVEDYEGSIYVRRWFEVN